MRRTHDRTRSARARGAAVGGAALGAALCAGAARPAAAQGLGMMAAGRLADWSDAAVGSEEEMYLRVLQVAGVARSTPWSLRPLDGAQSRGLPPDTARHPWAARARFGDPRARASFELLAPGVQAVYNSGYPFSLNDGFAWTGRGMTVAARGGFAARWQPSRRIVLSARVEPQVAWTANRRTDIVPNGLTGPQRFGDALEPTVIDNPQRFGDRAFARATLGQSTVRVDAFGVAVGASTANQWFGPALVDPLVLGTNAAGFPHVFVGTSRPVNLGIGTAHVRVQAGRLSQSDYSTVPVGEARRLLTAVTAVATVRGVPGLELGGTRLFHGQWPDDGDFGPRLRALTQGFFFTGGDPANGVVQNQLASVFGRWAWPGFEVYGEYLRNDANLDLRDFWQEPDHDAGYTVGARRVWRRPDGTLTAFRFETLNTRIGHLNRLRYQTRPYQHTPIRQGHTEAGEVLGSAAAQGGLATTLGWDRYRADGRWTAEAARRVVRSSLGEGAPERRWDVVNYVRVERLRFGRRQDVVAGVTAMAELNRNFGRDAYQLRLDGGVRFGTLRRPGGR